MPLSRETPLHSLLWQPMGQRILPAATRTCRISGVLQEPVVCPPRHQVTAQVLPMFTRRHLHMYRSRHSVVLHRHSVHHLMLPHLSTIVDVDRPHPPIHQPLLPSISHLLAIPPPALVTLLHRLPSPRVHLDTALSLHHSAQRHRGTRLLARRSAQHHLDVSIFLYLVFNVDSTVSVIRLSKQVPFIFHHTNNFANYDSRCYLVTSQLVSAFVPH